MKIKNLTRKLIPLVFGTLSLIGTSCMDNKPIEREMREVKEYENIQNPKSLVRIIRLQDTYRAHYTGHYETGTEGEELLDRNLIRTDTLRIDSIGYEN